MPIILLLMVLLQEKTIEPNDSLSAHQSMFIEQIYPLIRGVNSEIMDQRRGIYHLFEKYKNGQGFSDQENAMIKKYLWHYRCKSLNHNTGYGSSDFAALLAKIDIVPEKLLLARAAVISEWGAKEHGSGQNSVFGIFGKSEKKQCDTCFKSYDDIVDAIRDYAWLINSSQAYEKFRSLRMEARLNGEHANITPMAKSLAGGVLCKAVDYHRLLEANQIINEYLK